MPVALDKVTAARLYDEVGKVFHFEHDLAVARVTDKEFDNRVARIDNYMSEVRKTYKDPEYLRNPITPFESASRHTEDLRRRNFEAQKQALELVRTKDMIKKSEAVANRAERLSPA